MHQLHWTFQATPDRQQKQSLIIISEHVRGPKLKLEKEKVKQDLQQHQVFKAC